MGRLKLMTILGTRPEIIRLSQTIKKCDSYFDHILVHTGQNWDYALNQIFFEDLTLRAPDAYLDVVGNNPGETIGNIIAKSYELMLREKPDALLILGDTNSTLSALSAKRLKIPVFHMEAGNRCFDENLPEEINRRIVDHISDVNLCYSEQARRYLHGEGIPKDRCFVTGSPMAEVLSANKERIEKSQILKKLGLLEEEYIVLSAHREENIDNEKNFFQLMEAVNALAETYNIPVIYSTHPRSAGFIEKRQFHFHPKVRSLKPFSFSDYNHLQYHSFCTISDSGTLPEEAAYFKHFPAVCIRTSTERPEALEKGAFILGSISAKEVLQAVELAVAMADRKEKISEVTDYCEENVSSKVVRIIQSYTGIINRTVWRKDID
ncbi:non-hydrolyzing UDP-N-acetylglucosamine 2-epimerase [Anaerocolumna chitinilytica]|uniref:UDP-N-acetylglucosamine 2-epimerase (Non-hydrolyzing) n=1 Tax=Anaerocolumna chitinilytica TaxID=1727145 RepID=A0A7I8DTM4_9FIRM|nr:UDP-N-acetylglucosamine 2-epimerase (non-hydrolyzing) [Anaerocolumna chitinilytica]BCJ99646.1 UDP-N-acetylglucosamine 2-epimerase (non-hydrolyzing) [Anaerocolumna chitinilytica]